MWINLHVSSDLNSKRLPGEKCGLGQVYEGKLVHVEQIMHGKILWIYYNDGYYFSGPVNPFAAARYPSPVIKKKQSIHVSEAMAWT